MTIFLDLLPMMLGSALAPVWIIIVLLILKGPNGWVKAIAFVTGITLVRLLQGILVGYLLRSASGIESANGSSPIVSTLLLVLGILLLIAAAKKLMNEADPDAPPPKWMSAFDQADPCTILGMGALGTLIAPKLWVFTLAAIGVILKASLDLAAELKIFLMYVLGAQSLILLPLLLYAIALQRSANLLWVASD
ncbi:MAG: GAP family protein [Leptolyngbyaceae cyanobacterium bins.349]|nr:GAP family protein [Leptolyngbyaceae cyanobacterium bins.349]